MKKRFHTLFGDLPEQVYERQFLSLNSYERNKNLYVIFNDDNKNFNEAVGARGDTIYTYDNTNTCYYKINNKREITKNYLLANLPATNSNEAIR